MKSTAPIASILFLCSIGCSSFMAVAKTAGEGAVVGGAAAGGSFLGPIGAFFAGLLAFFGVRVAQGDATAERLRADLGRGRDAVESLSWWDHLAMSVGQWGLALAMLLLLGYVLHRQRVGTRFYKRMEQLEKATGVDLNRDGVVGSSKPKKILD